MSTTAAPSHAWVIEDDDETFSTLGRILNRAGWAVTRSSTLAEAMAKLDQIKDITLVILDFKLPDGNGIELLPWITQRPDPPDVAVITGYATTEDAVEALRLGVCDFVIKPFDVSDIRGMLRRIGTRQHLRVGSFIKHLEGIDARFKAHYETLMGIKRDVDSLKDLVHAAIEQRKDHA